MNNLTLFEVSEYNKNPNYMGDYPILKQLEFNVNTKKYDIYSYGKTRSYKKLDNALRFLNITLADIKENDNVDFLFNYIQHNEILGNDILQGIL